MSSCRRLGSLGYRVTVNTSADSDPCMGAADPRACGGPLTEVGRDNRQPDPPRRGSRTRARTTSTSSRSLDRACAATDVGHTPLKVDVTGPTLGPARRRQRSVDQPPRHRHRDRHRRASGMIDTAEFPSTHPPSTFLGSSTALRSYRRGSTVSATISAEGTHRSRAASTRPRRQRRAARVHAVVRIDKTGSDRRVHQRPGPRRPGQLRRSGERRALRASSAADQLPPGGRQRVEDARHGRCSGEHADRAGRLAGYATRSRPTSSALR